MGILSYLIIIYYENESESHSVISDSLQPHGLVHGILQARILEWVAFLFSRGLPNPGIKPRSPTLQADSLPAEPQGKPKNTGMGSYPFSRGSSGFRNLTGVSCITGGFFTKGAIREASYCTISFIKLLHFFLSL